MNSETGGNRLSAIGDADQCIARLHESRAAILELLRPHNDAVLAVRPDEDTWSALMVLEHLAMTEHSTARIIRRLRMVPAGGTMPQVQIQPARWRADGRSIAPDVVTPRGEGTRTEVEAAFASARETLLKTVEESRELLDGSATFTHAFFGDLNGLGWLRMAAWHESHHLEQLQRILSTDSNYGNGKDSGDGDGRREDAAAGLQWNSANG